MSRTSRRPLARLGGVLGAVLLLAAGCGGTPAPGSVESVAGVSPNSDATAKGAPTPEPTVPAPAAPATTTASRAPSTTVAPIAARRQVPTTIAAPVTTPPATVPKPAPGQRVEFTSAGVQAAAASVHQRIPLFAPTDAQLRTFADAACASFDGGQSQAQVEATVRQAVTYVQGASLTVTDAGFVVHVVVALRCPGYLP